MMGEDLQKLDLTDATEQLKATIQHAFVELIPDAQWQAMIEGELKKFTTETRIPNEYRNNPDKVIPPAFETMAQGILLEVARDKLKAKLAETDFLPDGQTVDGIIRDWLEANLDVMVKHFMTEVVANISTSIAVGAAKSLTSIVEQTLVSGVGTADPNNPGYDRQGNWMG